MNTIDARWKSAGMFAVAVAMVVAGRARAEHGEGGRALSPVLTAQASGTANRLQAVSAANEDVVWASGVKGTYTVTTDGGATWRAGVVPGAEQLQFRDVQAVSASVAYLLAAGSGSSSRIYKTEDGGATWTLQFQAPDDPDYFYDCFAFWTPERGVTMADGINRTARFPAIATRDGDTWHPIELPPAEKDEGAFAASGTCIATQGERRAWAVTTNSRVFASGDGGKTWAAYRAPIAGGSGTGGLFTVAFRDALHGLVGGGDFLSGAVLDNVARSADGGRTWSLTARAPVPGAVFGLAYAQEDEGEREDGRPAVVVTGPGGAAWSADEGNTWTSFAGVKGYWAVTFADAHSGWLVGTNGRILKISF